MGIVGYARRFLQAPAIPRRRHRPARRNRTPDPRTPARRPMESGWGGPDTTPYDWCDQHRPVWRNWQRTRLVIERLGVQVPSPAPNNPLTRAATPVMIDWRAPEHPDDPPRHEDDEGEGGLPGGEFGFRLVDQAASLRRVAPVGVKPAHWSPQSGDNAGPIDTPSFVLGPPGQRRAPSRASPTPPPARAAATRSPRPPPCGPGTAGVPFISGG